MKKKITSNLTSAVFAVFLLVIGVLYAVMPKSDFSPTEKRKLAPCPEFSLSNLADGKFTSDFEKFLSDQTPLRKFFVSVSAYYNLARGNNGSNGVYLGSDGWLIEKPFDRENRFVKNIKSIVRFSADVSVPSTLVAVPEKGFVYSGHLPKNSLAYQDEAYTKKIAGLTNGKVGFVNLTDSFLKSAGSEQLFYKTDHHWTSAGSFLAYTEICRSIGMTAADKSDFAVEKHQGFRGTSYSTSCYTLTRPDCLEIWRNKKDCGAAKVTITDGGKTKVFGNMFFDSAFGGGDEYLAFLDGNHSIVHIVTGNPGDRLLVVKDSFAHCLVPFLAENCSEITMVDLRCYKKPISQLIDSGNYTQLLFVYGMKNLAESSIILR